MPSLFSHKLSQSLFNNPVAAPFALLIMESIKHLSSIILTDHCVEEYFDRFNFFDGACFKSSLSSALGIALILGSLLVKLPQILKIFNNKSGEGVSLLSVSFDLCAIMIYACYSIVNEFPFSSWGETSFLLIQTLVIGFLILHYSGRTLFGFLYSIAYTSVFLLLISSITPKDVLWTLQGFNIPILLVGKLSQAVINYNNGHTGQLSAITMFLLLAGSAARIFTNIQETGDFMSIITYSVSTGVNGLIVLQILYYWNVDSGKLDAKKKLKKAKKVD